MDEKIAFYYSPYIRTSETLDEVMSNFDGQSIISCLEEPRISEQQIGNFQNVNEVLTAKRERSKFGRFYYRFPTGEAGLDVYSRVSSFIPTLIRDCVRHRDSGVDLDKLNVVSKCHLRSLLHIDKRHCAVGKRNISDFPC